MAKRLKKARARIVPAKTADDSLVVAILECSSDRWGYRDTYRTRPWVHKSNAIDAAEAAAKKLGWELEWDNTK